MNECFTVEAVGDTIAEKLATSLEEDDEVIKILLKTDVVLGIDRVKENVTKLAADVPLDFSCIKVENFSTSLEEDDVDENALLKPVDRVSVGVLRKVDKVTEVLADVTSPIKVETLDSDDLVNLVPIGTEDLVVELGAMVNVVV